MREVAAPNTKIERRRAIVVLEDGLRGLRPHDCPVEHLFVDGLYVRQMFIQAGVALVGHIHRFQCLNVIPYGDIIVFDPDTGTRRVVGPTMFSSESGVKRAGWAQADTLWTTVHANADNERDIEKLEARLIVPMTEEWLALESKS